MFKPATTGTSAATSSSGGGVVGAAWNARSQRALTSNMGEGPWYGLRGWQFAGTSHVHQDWSQTLLDCHGIIAFDAVLCAGPRHLNSPAWGKVNIDALDAASSSASPGVPHWNVAQFSLGGCAGCGSAPEGWTVWGEGPTAKDEREENPNWRGSGPTGTHSDIGRFPLLPHPPLHSCSIKVAMCPAGQPLNSHRTTSTTAQSGKARFIPRCGACLRDRYCTACHKWWCESCYIGPWVTTSPESTTSPLNPNVNLVSLTFNSNSTREDNREPCLKVRDGLCYAQEGCSAHDNPSKNEMLRDLDELR